MEDLIEIEELEPKVAPSLHWGDDGGILWN